jgi:hypothetical protein
MPDITSNLVGYWALDDGTGTTAIDSGSGANNGSLINTPTWLLPGKIGAAALTLNGSNQYVTMVDPVNLRPGTNGFTVAAWVKTTMTARGMIFTSYHAFLDLIMFEMGRNAAGRFNFEWRDQTSANGFEYTGATYNDGNWHHLAGVQRQTDGVYLFADGLPIGNVSQPTLTSSLSTNAQAWQIGAYDGANAPFNGSVDDVRFYHRSLADADIAALFALGAAGPATAKAFYTNFQKTKLRQPITAGRVI